MIVRKEGRWLPFANQVLTTMELVLMNADLVCAGMHSQNITTGE